MFPYPFSVVPVMHSQDLLAMRGMPPGMQAFNPYFAPQMPNPNNFNPNLNPANNNGGQSPHNNRQQYDERSQNNRQHGGRAGGRGVGGRGGRSGGRGGRGNGRGGGVSTPNHEGYHTNHHPNTQGGPNNANNDANVPPKFQHKRPEHFQLPPKGVPTIITPPTPAFVAAVGVPSTGHHQNGGMTPAGLVAASNCLSSPFLPASHAQHLSPLTAPAAPFMGFQLVPMSPKSPLTMGAFGGGVFGTVSSVPPPRAMPVLVPMPVSTPEMSGASADVPDFDAEMFRLRELKLVELIKEWMNSPQNNPKQGSLPSERVQNCIKSMYPQLYASVIGSEYANQWHRFVKSHLDCFEIVYPGGEGRCLPRIRLLTHNAWESADQEETQERKTKELCVVQTLQSYLESFPQHEANIEDFIREFPKLAPMLEAMSPTTIPSNESPPVRSNGNSSTPRFRDIVRLIKKYKEYFTFIASRPGTGVVPRVRLLTTQAPIGGVKESTQEANAAHNSKDGLSPPTIPLVPVSRDGTVKKTAPPSGLSAPDSGLAPLRAPSPVSMGDCLMAVEPMTSMPLISATHFMSPHSPTTAPAAFASWNLIQSWAALSPPVASPTGLWSASASPTANSSPHGGAASSGSLSPTAAQLKKQNSKQLLQPASPAVVPQTPQTTTSVQSPVVGTPLGLVPDSDPHLMPLRELKLRNLVVQYLENESTNPTKGSLPSERVQNWVKVQHADLYKSVIGAGFGNQWHRFISKYDTVFNLFTVQEYARTIWRMRLACHTEWENADERERTHKRVKEDHYVDCLTKFLQCRIDHKCTMDEFLAAYPQMVQNREWSRYPMAKDMPQPPPLPARGDFARFVRRHWELFNYDNKSYTIILVGAPELERASAVLAEMRRREEVLCSPNTSPTATPLSLSSIRSPPMSDASPIVEDARTNKWDQRYHAQQQERTRVPLRHW